MSAVAASPDALGDLARRLRDQAGQHHDVARYLGRAVDEAHASGPALVAGGSVLAEAAQLSNTIDDLVGSLDDLARFVREVADALAEADGTLAGVGANGGSGTSPWTRLGAPGGDASDRRYAKGVRRVGTATFDGPLRRHDRTRQVQVGGGSVRDGWSSERAQVTVFDLPRTTRAGRGATTRLGTDAAHLDVDVFAGATATVRASAGVGDAEAHLSLAASVEAGAHARAAAFAGSGLLGVGAGAKVFVGAQAAGEARLGVGKTGVDAHVDAHALVGGSAVADGEVDVLGVRTTGHAGVSYGVGGELAADAHLGLEKIELRFDVGATVGLGISVGFDVSVSPRAVAGGAAKTAKKVFGWLS